MRSNHGITTKYLCYKGGAICVQEDVPELIETAAATLYREVLALNSLQEQEVAYLMITQTNDLKSRNPATGLRKAGYCAATPLFCIQELEIEGMLEKSHQDAGCCKPSYGKKTIPVFMQGAEVLRPEFAHPSL